MTGYNRIILSVLFVCAHFLIPGNTCGQNRVLIKTSFSEFYQANLEWQGKRWAVAAGYRYTAPQNPGGFFVMPSIEVKRFRSRKAIVFRRFTGIYLRYKGYNENRDYRLLSRSDFYAGGLWGISARLGKWYAEVFGGMGWAVVRNISSSPLDLRLNISAGRVLFEGKKKKLLPIL